MKTKFFSLGVSLILIINFCSCASSPGKNTVKDLTPLIVGTIERASFPSLGIFDSEIKVDTGADSSALHAFDFKEIDKNGEKFLQFKTLVDHKPIQCEAPLIGYRKIKSSSGKAERRPIIRATIMLGAHRDDIEISLTRRDKMAYRFLLGRSAMREPMLIDPNKKFLLRRN